MDYNTFKNFCMTHLWKMGDSVVLDALPNLITMAEAELDRKLRELPDRETASELICIGSYTPLPPDCHRVRHVANSVFGGMTYVGLDEISDYFDRYRNVAAPTGYFSTVGNQFLLIGHVDPLAPVYINLIYDRKIPRFSDTQVSWVADDYPDLYLYAVLKHTAPFLREDERLPLWQTLYNDALASVIDDGADRRFTGSPIKQKLSRTIR